MEYFIEQALTYTECLNKIRLKYGEKGVTILSHKNIRLGGVFGLFAKDGVEITGYTSNNVIKAGDFGPPASPPQGSEGATPAAPADFTAEKKRVLETATAETMRRTGADPTLKKILDEMRELKEQLGSPSPFNVTRMGSEDHETINRITDILSRNDFSPSYTMNIVERIKKECSLDALNDYKGVEELVLDWIGDSIKIYKEEEYHRRPRIMVLVGPTGVGKTTTIAKLAAVFGIGNSGGPKPLSVRMVTIDAYRMGAKAQIEAFGNIMQIPVSYVDNYDDLKKNIAQHTEDVELFLIDTIGRSPRNSAQLGEMKQLLDACGTEAELYLTITAVTKFGDLKEIIRQFEPFNYRAVIITKLDETIRVGNVISALSDLGKSVFYVTDGQKVPTNIQKASVVRFLINLEGFQVNRARIEERFPSGESEQIQWRK
ncbi:MAG: flagellar biosynthesis protein FlhF [Treponema sp.]|jgi:flagellar biosynthesis protein FlhF|nr:flagellar biosynthesis protein FlhF [Treponema sp.]